MVYRKCPICDLNYITEEEDCCKICKQYKGTNKLDASVGVRIHKTIQDTCKIFVFVETVKKNTHVNHDITGYSITDSKGVRLGVVLEDYDKKREGRAIIRFLNELEDKYGSWHTIITTSGPVKYCDILKSIHLANSKGKYYFELWIE